MAKIKKKEEAPRYYKAVFKRSHMFLGLLIPLTLFIVLGLAPSLVTGFLSLWDYNTARTGAETGTSNMFVGLDNYRIIFGVSAGDTMTSLWRTFLYSGSVVILQNLIGLLLALLLNNKLIRGRNFFRAVIFMPVVLGITVVVVTMKILFNPINGPVALFLAQLGTRSDFFGDPNIAFNMIIGAHIWQYIGFSLIVFLAALQNVPSDLTEAALVDGAGPYKVFTKITFPMLYPTIVTMAIYVLMNTLGQIQHILLFTGGRADTRTIGIQMFINAFGDPSGSGTTPPRGQGYAAAFSMVMFVITLTVILGTRFIMKKGEKSTE